MIADEIFSIKIDDNYLNSKYKIKNIGDYLSTLLIKLLEEEESFNSKRPLGNSGWIYDLINPLVAECLVEGFICTDGSIECRDEASAVDILKLAIKKKFNSDS